MKKITTLFIILLFFCVSSLQAKVYTDEMGRDVFIKEYPKRIVSLTPGITEILFALGIKGHVVGVTKFSDYPPEAKRKPKVGSYINLGLESIISLHPDLIIASADGNRKEDISRLTDLGFTVYVIYPQNLEGILSSIAHIGQITGAKAQAKDLTDNMRSKIRFINNALSGVTRRRVFVQIEPSPLISVGKDTFWDNLISLAGGQNIVSENTAGYPKYSLEEVLARNP